MIGPYRYEPGERAQQPPPTGFPGSLLHAHAWGHSGRFIGVRVRHPLREVQNEGHRSRPFVYAARVDARRYAIDEVNPHCDLNERIRLMPPSVATRGFYFRSMENVLERAGKLERFQRLFPERLSGVGWYPMSEFLTRLAVAGGMLYGPENVHRGMHEIGRHNVSAVMGSLLGKMLLRFLVRDDPRKLLQQGVAGRRQTCNVGHWELSFPTEHSAVVSMFEEYFYIESYLLGAALGTFEAVGIRVSAEAALVDRFTGTHTLRWGPSYVDTPR